MRRTLPGELIAADELSLRLVDGSVFHALPGMTLPPFSPGTALRIEYTVSGGQAFLRTVPEQLPGG